MEDAALQARIEAVYPLQGVYAGSALLRVGQRLLAVQDNAWSVAWISLPGREVSLQSLRGDGRTLAKDLKPDFEAAVATPDGAIHLLGSGSTAGRCDVVRIAPDLASFEIREMPTLYACLQQALELEGRPNIEAAVLLHNGRLRLFHRGVGAVASASVDLNISALEGFPSEITNIQRYQFGSLEGVALHITDVANLAQSCLYFIAAAEDVADAITDGPVVGSVMGRMEYSDAGSRVRWARIWDPDGTPTLRKTEGLVMDEDRRGAWVLTDPDSRQRPAELCRVVLEGFS